MLPPQIFRRARERPKSANAHYSGDQIPQ